MYTYGHKLGTLGRNVKTLGHKINCVFSVQFRQVYTMEYCHLGVSLIPCITFDRIDVPPQLLKKECATAAAIPAGHGHQVDEITRAII